MAVLLITAFVTLAIILFAIHQKYTNGYCKSKKRLDGKTCIVTGGTRGMGLEIAREFARRGARVIIACPFEEEGINAQKLITNETGNHDVVFKHLNLACLKSTRNFASDILKTEDRLDLLVNNAGAGSKDALTRDGLNFVMQINYYGHFLLTLLLFPLLQKTGTSRDKARILNTTSLLHFIGKYEPKNMNRVGYWYKVQYYANSKLCFVLFSKELARRIGGYNVVVNAIDPGVVGTKIFMMNFGTFIGLFIEQFLSLATKTPWQGCQTALHVALDDKLGDSSGGYFRNCELCAPKAVCYDEDTAKKLWEESVQLVKLEPSEIEQLHRKL
ncbi:retinol dehydrogenase 13-like [Ostrinia furnacalis]|uniref:retinol dehydrogenase 13-like n=1 Tax=Ostrinia furnacalis TaxID=93504 RepID=UPI00103A755E|nr:retinol dehydrogenase 13-like [Ostrinia furnacalis]